MKRSILATTAAIALAVGGYGLVTAGASIVDVAMQPETGGPCLSGYSRNLVNHEGELFACVADAWVAQTGVAGPGADGATGPAGATGPQGASGTDGTAGTTGPTGPTGADGLDGFDGMDGANGADGATGPTGATGATGSVGAITVTNGSVFLGATSGGAAMAYCPDGMSAIGGGWNASNTTGVNIYYFGPGAGFSNYQVVVYNANPTPLFVDAYAYCAPVTINDLRVMD